MIKNQLLSSALVFGLLQLAPCGAHADIVLVGAPVPILASWDTQVNIPPSGPIFLFADQFSLSGDEFVTDISARLFGAFPSVAFNLSLLADSPASNPVPLFSADLDLPNVEALFSLPINSVLPAGTYYLRLTTDSFVGWRIADPTSFVTSFGSVVDGIWQFNPSQGVWTFFSDADFPGTSPGVFIVNGPDVPEPSTLVLAASGIVGLAAWGWRRRQRPAERGRR